AELGQGGAMLQLKDIFRRQHLGAAAYGGDQGLIEGLEQGVQPVAVEGLPSLPQRLLRRAFQERLDDAGAQLDAGKVGASAELLEEESQAARLVALLGLALVRAQGVAGAGE